LDGRAAHTNPLQNCTEHWGPIWPLQGILASAQQTSLDNCFLSWTEPTHFSLQTVSSRTPEILLSVKNLQGIQ
jgi:hypothetical protein